MKITVVGVALLVAAVVTAVLIVRYLIRRVEPAKSSEGPVLSH